MNIPDVGTSVEVPLKTRASGPRAWVPQPARTSANARRKRMETVYHLWLGDVAAGSEPDRECGQQQRARRQPGDAQPRTLFEEQRHGDEQRKRRDGVAAQALEVVARERR